MVQLHTPGQIARSVKMSLPYAPSEQQQELIERLADFVVCRKPGDVFVLYGYAGTGKTTIVAALVTVLDRMRLPSVLLAPTGRAAKVFTSSAGRSAHTIHKRLYRPDGSTPEDTRFFLASNNDRNTLFIVDEASMIGDAVGESSLLNHLTRHVYSAEGCNMILIGDTAQLPPVGQSDSPAMNPEVLKSYGLHPQTFSLEEPMRQASLSGILHNAVKIRSAMMKNPLPVPQVWTNGMEDVRAISSQFFLEQLADSYAEVTPEETIIITRSNKRASIFNHGVRTRVLYAEEELQRGERLVVAKNNYYWSRKIKEIDFIANGDIVEVNWIGGTETRYGHRFADVEITYPGSDTGISAKVILDSLSSDAPALTRQQMLALYNAILAEKEGDPAMRARSMERNPYYNALQVKYAYCLTCHKAQGGQWKHVYIDMGYLPAEGLGIDFYRWLYTAVTRARYRLWFVNPSIPVDGKPFYEID